MSVMKLKPACKDYLWGGNKLIRDFHKEYDGENLAETWELSCHPDNQYALKNEGQYGKTEIFQKRMENNTLLEVLNKVPVQRGDVLFIEAGTIHAIGKDIVVAEIQQNSNVTYRVFDYGRVDKAGKQRDLHIEKALAVINRIPIIRNKSAVPHLAKCDYFTVDKLNLDGKMMKKIIGTISEDSFANLLVMEGEGIITCNGESVDFGKGDSLFLPAGSGEFQVEGTCEALMTTIGEKASPVRIAVDMTSKQVQVGLLDTGYNCFSKEVLQIKKARAIRLPFKILAIPFLKFWKSRNCPYNYIAEKCFRRNGTGIPDVKAAEVGGEAGLIGAANLI